MPRVTTSVWDGSDCARAHAASLEILLRAGVDVPHEGALRLLAAAGARIEGTRAYLPASLIDEALRSAPASFEIPGRGKGGMLVEQGLTYFGTGPDCIYVHDPYTRERRRARLKDIVASAHLCDQLDDVDFVMSMGLAEDAPISCDDLLQFRAMLSGTTKPLVVSTSHGGDGLEAMLEMAGIYGERGSFGCLIMSSPPLKFDANAADKLIACARLGVPIILAPAPSAGATAPASISAAVVVGDAEVMAGLCIHQLAAAGAPFVYGVGASAMDMRTALDPYVGPDHFLGNQAACDLARSYGIPSWSYAGPSDAKTLDEQWSADVAVTALLGALSRATLLHDLGYMESGMAGSPESIVLGAELVGFVRSFLRELPLDDDSLQLEAIIAAGPGGNYLGHPHTRRHHREFWQTNLFDHDVFERWHAGGAATLRDRVAERTLKLLDAPGELGLCDDEDRTIDEVIATVARSRG